MDYLLTQVMTRTNVTRWVPRLFVLKQDSLTCFYESAPHLQDQGQNNCVKFVIPIRRSSNQTGSSNQYSATPAGSRGLIVPNKGNLKA